MTRWIPCFLLACSGASKIDEPTDTQTTPQEDEEITLFINELLAKSDSTEDWLELYNPQTQAQDISGFQLQDSAGIPWSIPQGTSIDAEGFLLIWADDALEEGLHAPFKLSKDGENLSLLSPTGTTIDQVDFPALAAEESYARIEDGGADWEIRLESTPESSNQLQ